MLLNSSTCYEVIMYNGPDTLLMDIMRAQRYKELVENGTVSDLDFTKNHRRLKGIEP